MTQLIVVEKGVCKKGMESIEDINGGNDVNGKILKEFLARSPYYKRLRIVNRDGMAMTRVFRDGALFPVEKAFDPVSATHHRKQGASVSKVLRDPLEDGYIVYFARAVHCPDGDSVGYVVLDFDYGKVFDLVRSVVIGVEGYAFMVDHLGCTVAHPRFRPYEYNLSKYSDPRLRELVVDMICGETGWKRFNYLGEKAAAYAVIPAMDWSLAVSIPIEEFKKEAKTLRKRMLEVVIITLLLAGFVVVILSYHLLKPIKRLAVATERIAGGDLAQEIPVKSSDEMGMLTRSFNRMVENLRRMRDELLRSEKLIAMGKLSAGVAHEVRNPLNAMKGAIVYLQRRRSGDALILEYTGLILEEVERLNRFVTEFLSYARQPPLNLMPEDLNLLVGKTTTLFEEKLREKKIIILKDLDPHLPMIPMDSHQIGQVIANLLINAMQAMPEGGTLEITTKALSETESEHSLKKVVMTMRDNGVGIPKDDLNRIFDPFFSTGESGTGLGLSISLRIVENHGGTLRIESREGEGTTVTLALTGHKENGR